jgi:glycosyltransferase involved in cell wall biosynthesis
MLSPSTKNKTDAIELTVPVKTVDGKPFPVVKEEKKFSIIIPAYNEEKRIKPVLEEICSYIRANNLPWNIIVSIDGNDGTEIYVRKVMSEYQFVSYNRGMGRSGKGGAIKRAFKYKLGDFVILMDSDGAIAFKDILDSVPLLNKYDLINFDRYKNGTNKIPLIRRFVSRGYNVYLKILLGLNINDTQCGYKIMKADVAKNIFTKITVSNGFFYSNLFFYLKQLNAPVIEVPIKYNHVEGSKFNVSTMVLGGFISALAFRIRMSPFGKFIPKTLYELYYRKFRWI